VVEEKEIEEKLLEAIKKKKEAEKKVEKVKGRRVKYIEDALGFLKKFVDVEAYLSDRTLTVVLKPKEEYSFLFTTTEPFKYVTKLTKEEVSNLEKTSKMIAALVLDKFTMNYPKLPFIIDFEMLVRRVGRPRAVEIFAYLCQKGSPYHCSFLYNYVMKLVNEIFSLSGEDKSQAKYLARYIESAGFKKLAKILEEIDVEDLDSREKSMILEAIRHGLREIFSRCANVYEKPSDMPENAVEKSWEVIYEACKEPEYVMFPEPIDETPILRALSKIASRVRELEQYVESEKEEVSLEKKKLEEEIEKLKREKKRLQKEKKKLIIEIKKLKEEKKKLEEEKKRLKERMKKKMKKIRGE